MKFKFGQTFFESRKSAFTLVELLIAISIFAMMAVMATNLLLNLTTMQKKTGIQNPLYDEGSFIFGNLTKEIKSSSIDYEEYHSIYVIQSQPSSVSPEGKAGIVPPGGPYYGINYGVYGSRFFNPGKSQNHSPTYNPDDLGIECSYPKDSKESCEIFYTNSEDLNTGQNPYKIGNNQPEEGDAFCGSGVGRCKVTEKNEVEELFLIDSSGSQKTIIARRVMDKITGDYAIGLVRMQGKDLDQNGVIDVFGCKEEFNCQDDPKLIEKAIKYPFIQNLVTEKGSWSKEWADYIKNHGISLPQKSDLESSFEANTSQFIPISPEYVNVKSLKFIINPVEDPYKAYAEDNVRQHPTVTIIMTIGLSKAAQEDYPGEFEDVTVQAMVTAGVIGKIDSYPPVTDIFRSGYDKSWISEVLPLDMKK